jgi:hypothetical protein
MLAVPEETVTVGDTKATVQAYEESFPHPAAIATNISPLVSVVVTEQVVVASEQLAVAALLAVHVGAEVEGPAPTPINKRTPACAVRHRPTQIASVQRARVRRIRLG